MLTWNNSTCPDGQLATALRTLAEYYPVREAQDGANLTFIETQDHDCLDVAHDGTAWVIRYGRVNAALRGLAFAMAGATRSETMPFDTLGILLDCTRGNVITVEAFKEWLRVLALLGYNMTMIYVKDAYELPGEPFFGFMRGAYSQDEIRQIDAYAKKLGIEMIASIQALGHVEPLMQYSAYTKVKDTSSTFLVDEPETYKLLEKMLTFWSEALTSRRIHLGMDETMDLGRGRFLDLNGYQQPVELYNRHLARLCDMCESLNLKPLIWSDMYFRFANKNLSYYEPDAEIRQEVKDMIPKSVQLCSWDYYHRDKDTYAKMLMRTGALNGTQPVMASGVWTWTTLWTDYEQTEATVKPCIQACRETNTREIIFTMWGDDGGHCEPKSAWAGLAWAADEATQKENPHLEATFKAITGKSYANQIAAGKMILTLFNDKGQPKRKIREKTILWDDPIMWMAHYGLNKLDSTLLKWMVEQYQDAFNEVSKLAQDEPELKYPATILNLLKQKVQLYIDLIPAYKNRDRQKLKAIRDQQIAQLAALYDDFANQFRDVWFQSYKSYGLELFQIRIGTQKQRLEELKDRIQELLDGKVEEINELDYDGDAIHVPITFLGLATGCFFI